MRISELSTDNALDVFCEVVPYVENIMSDTGLINELKRKMDITEETTNAEKMSMVVEKVNAITPILFKKRRDDVLGIVAAINGMKLEDVKKQNLAKTLWQIREIITDKEFISFFRSFAGQAGRK